MAAQFDPNFGVEVDLRYENGTNRNLGPTFLLCGHVLWSRDIGLLVIRSLFQRQVFASADTQSTFSSDKTIDLLEFNLCSESDVVVYYQKHDWPCHL